MKANIKTILIPVSLVAALVLASSVQAQGYHTPRVPRVGDYSVGRHIPHAGEGARGLEADKSVHTPSAPAGFGSGTVPGVGVKSGTTESRSPNNALGELGGDFSGDILGDLNRIPAGVAPAPSASRGGPGVLNPYAPAKPGQQAPFVNPYPPANARINSVPVQYNAGTPAGVQKPFADYRAPDNFSPWMNLYRGGNRSGVDNYNFYVRPALEAQREKEQAQHDMRSMQQQQNAAATQQHNQGRYGASYGDLSRGPASYGFSGGASAPGAYSPAPASPVLAPQDDTPNKDLNTNPPTSVNPYAPLLDNTYDFNFNPYAPIGY